MGKDGGVVIVTGAGAGFGRVTALALADAGYTVYGAFRGSRLGFDDVSASLKAEAAAHGSTIETVRIDVTDDASVDAGVSSILAKAGRIVGLVNVAGFGVHGPWETFTVQQFKDQLETNLVGVFRMCLAVAPTMRAQKSGTIVNFGSDAGIKAGFWEVAYSASKYGVEGMSLGMRLESQQFGIRVCVVEPGWFSGTDYDLASVSTVDWDDPQGPYGPLVKTFVTNQAKVEGGKPGKEQVADKVVELIRSDDPPFRSPVGCSPVRTVEESDADYERRVFAFYGIEEFRSPALRSQR